MNLILAIGWIVDEWFPKPIIHGILQNLIQVLTRHPQLCLPMDKTIVEEKSMQLQAK
jgi:hypothetical protein